MTELSDGATLVVLIFAFFTGIGLIAAMVVTIIALNEPSPPLWRDLKSSPLPIAPDPVWYTKTYTEPAHKKPVRWRSLPYGAYGTDVRDRGARQQDERE